MRFTDHGRRVVMGAFDGGEITSDAGGLLPREVAGLAAEIAPNIGTLPANLATMIRRHLRNNPDRFEASRVKSAQRYRFIE
ncbi:hypothetical protein [Niveispirillum irakense]|uniref:hypothetical protein n=1 Tax=Niveispirillum irakense TaxID=34011 RepID=UPI0003F8A5D0|nr:hypothetical protein [Niveispirillum irakense]